MSRALALCGAALALACAGAPPAEDAKVAVPPPRVETPSTWVRTPPPPPSEAGALKPYTVTRAALPNGLAVVVVESHGRPVTRVSLVLPRGSVSDPPGQDGATWMAVELAGDSYEGDDHFEKSWRRHVVELGGAPSLNVEHDTSLLQISGYAKDVAKYLDLLAGAVRTPRHGPEAFKARRFAVQDTLEDVEASDSEAFEQLVANSAFGRGHPYARPVFGSLDGAPLGLEDVISHQTAVLSPSGATLLVVGDVQASAVVQAATKAFGPWRGERFDPAPIPPVSAAGAQQVGFLERPGATTLVVCATRSLGDVRGPDATVDVLAAVLGRGLGGRLSRKLRDADGFTYDAHVSVVRRRHARALVACSPLQAAKAADGVRDFRDVLTTALQTPPTEAELARAKALALADLEEGAEDALRIDRTWLQALALGRAEPRLDEQRRELEAVTAAEVQRVARTALDARTVRWVLSGDARVAAQAAAAHRLGKLEVLRVGR